MQPDDSAYFEMRANHALDLAQQATHPAVVRAHYELAELYLERMIECRNMRDGQAQTLFDHWASAPISTEIN